MLKATTPHALFTAIFWLLAFFMAAPVMWIWIGPLLAQSPQDLADVTTTGGRPSEGTLTNAETVSLARLANAEARVAAVELQVALQSKAIELQRQQMASIDSTARFMVTVAGVFALLLGAAAWKTLDEQRQSAEKHLNLQLAAAKQQIELTLGHVNELKAEIARDFPMFAHLRDNFTRVLRGLRSACAGLKPQDLQSYEHLSWDERQRVLFYEKAMASSTLFETSEKAREISDVFRYLGVFYGSRYTVDRLRTPRTAAEGVTSQDPDILQDSETLNRARYYFEHAIQLDPDNYFAYMQGGLFTMWYDNAEMARYSRDLLTKAAEIRPNKQRPLINVAILELNAFNDPDAALEALTHAQGRAEFEEQGSKPKPQRIEYLQACAYALKGDKSSDPVRQERMYEQAQQKMEAAQNTVEELPEKRDDWISVSFLQRDERGARDRDRFFSRLANHPNFSERFAQVVAKMEQPGAL